MRVRGWAEKGIGGARERDKSLMVIQYDVERSGVSDYKATPEATQWNGSMDEPPVASLGTNPSWASSIIHGMLYRVYWNSRPLSRDHSRTPFAFPYSENSIRADRPVIRFSFSSLNILAVDSNEIICTFRRDRGSPLSLSFSLYQLQISIFLSFLRKVLWRWYPVCVSVR